MGFDCIDSRIRFLKFRYASSFVFVEITQPCYGARGPERLARWEPSASRYGNARRRVAKSVGRLVQNATQVLFRSLRSFDTIVDAAETALRRA